MSIPVSKPGPRCLDPGHPKTCLSTDSGFPRPYKTAGLPSEMFINNKKEIQHQLSSMANDILTHEEQQLTILQLMGLLEKQSETITRLKTYSLDIRGIAELEANRERGPAGEVEQSDPMQCIVCYDEGDNLRLAPCMHAICLDCAENWLVKERKVTCPLCRYSPISMDDLVPCPRPTAPAPTSDLQTLLDYLRCRLAEYRSLVLQVETKLESNIAPEFHLKLSVHFRQQASEIEHFILGLDGADEITAADYANYDI